MFQFINFNMDDFFMKKYLFLFALFYSTVSVAGWDKLTHHSSANCFNNESISWHLGHSYTLNVQSVHRSFRGRHGTHMTCGTKHSEGYWCVDNKTWLETAICWKEQSENGEKIWTVEGTHIYKSEANPVRKYVVTKATDCYKGEG